MREGEWWGGGGGLFERGACLMLWPRGERSVGAGGGRLLVRGRLFEQNTVFSFLNFCRLPFLNVCYYLIFYFNLVKNLMVILSLDVGTKHPGTPKRS